MTASLFAVTLGEVFQYALDRREPPLLPQPTFRDTIMSRVAIAIAVASVLLFVGTCTLWYLAMMAD